MAETYRMQLKCYNCGHTWYKQTLKGNRLYTVKEIGVCAVLKDVGIKVEKHIEEDTVICPYCHTFTDIINCTQTWAPQTGYGSDNIEFEEDNFQKMEKTKKEKEKARQKVIEMEEKKYG